MSADPLDELRTALGEAFASLGADLTQEPTLERPKRSEFGDYSTNAALLLAPGLGEQPREVAKRLEAPISTAVGDDLERLEIAGPGFVNLFMSDSWLRRVAGQIAAGDHCAASVREPSIHLEFVSANPTGPLTAAGGRGAAYGDSLARILEHAGHRIEREYYLNDAGSQVHNFAASIAAKMKGEEPPTDGYAGAYVGELADQFKVAGVNADDLNLVGRLGTEAMRDRIETTLERFGVRFDNFSSERELHEQGALEATLEELRAAGQVYDSDGALWLRTSDHGDDKDRVLVRSDHEPTYFFADIAYHRDKLRRGAEHMIVPLGADHHGYVPRMRAAVGILSGDPLRYESPIMQLVNIVEQGARTRMSKRRGEFVTLDELIDDIGRDAARFFLLQRSHDSVIDLDLELARSKSQDNPVYYVQYAHARIASIMRRATSLPAGSGAAEIPCPPSERALVLRLLDFPSEIETAAERRSPHRICAYATSVAADFHAFYRDCRVIGADVDEGQEGLEAARLVVCRAAQSVIKASLGLLGVSAPERM